MTSSLLFNVTTFLFLVSTLLFFVYLVSKNNSIGLGASMAAFIGWGAETVAIGLRWKESYDMGHGHAPLSNLYESVVFFAWTIILIYGIIEIKYKYRVIGAFVLPFALLGMAWAQLGLQQRHRAAGAGPAEQLAAVPRYHLLPRLRGLCGCLRYFHHVPDQGKSRG